MKKQTNLILITVLILQLALIAFLYRPGQEKLPPRLNLFEGLVAEQVTAIDITDDEGNSLSLTREGKSWTVGSNNYPADQESIKTLLAKIAKLQSARVVTRTRASHSRLKAGKELFNRKVVLKGEGEETQFFLGTAPGSKSVHLRRAGEDEVYLTNNLASWELQADKESWWQTKYVNLDQEIQELALQNANGVIHLSKDEDGNWQLKENPDGRSLDQQQVEELVESLNPISISKYLDQPPKADKAPITTINYQTKETKLTLQIWPKDEEHGDYTVKSSQSTFHAKIRSYILDQAIKIKQGVFVNHFVIVASF